MKVLLLITGSIAAVRIPLLVSQLAKENYEIRCVLSKNAEKLIKQYHTKAPFVKQLMDNVSRKANDRGKIRTLLGRACHFDLWQPVQFGVFKPLPLEQARKEYDEPLKRAFTYKALNKLIQGVRQI